MRKKQNLSLPFSFISEDDIERAMVRRLVDSFGYDSLNCHTSDPEDLNDGSGRRDKEVVLDRLKRAAVALNPEIPEAAIDEG